VFKVQVNAVIHQRKIVFLLYLEVFLLHQKKQLSKTRFFLLKSAKASISSAVLRFSSS